VVIAGPLLETKLHVPRWRRGLVARPRLSERLSRGTQAALTLVSAPAGFGKTTLGYALWRSRSVPRWLAALFVIGLLVAELQSSGGPKVVLFMLPFAAAMILLAARLWRAAALPASQSKPQPTAVPA
jgi:hypothetical protein